MRGRCDICGEKVPSNSRLSGYNVVEDREFLVHLGECESEALRRRLLRKYDGSIPAEFQTVLHGALRLRSVEKADRI